MNWPVRLRAAALLVVVVCGLVFSAGCAPEAGTKLVVYSAGPRPLAEFACRSFEEATGISVELFSATTGQIMAKLEAERFRPRADVVILASQTAAFALKEKGRLLAHQPEAVAMTHQDWHDPEGFYHATGGTFVGVATREGTEWSGVGWRDLLISEKTGAGQLVMPSPSRSGTAGDFLLVYRQLFEASFWEDFEKGRQQGLVIVGANSQAVTGLIMGAYGMVFSAADYIICREIARGEPLQLHYPEDRALLVLRPIAILNSTDSPDLGRAFVEHVLSHEVQERVAATHLLPAKKDVATSEVRSRFSIPQPLPFDMEQGLEDQRTLMKAFQYRIERGGGG